MTERFTDVQGYLASFPADVRAVLEELRATVLAAAPGSAERISYQIPTVTADGRYLVYYAGWKRHVGLYPVPTLPEQLESEVAPFRSGKATVRFPLGDPLPVGLIRRLVEALVEARRHGAG